jgi:hypothetical protein
MKKHILIATLLVTTLMNVGCKKDFVEINNEFSTNSDNSTVNTKSHETDLRDVFISSRHVDEFNSRFFGDLLIDSVRLEKIQEIPTVAIPVHSDNDSVFTSLYGYYIDSLNTFFSYVSTIIVYSNTSYGHFYGEIIYYDIYGKKLAHSYLENNIFVNDLEVEKVPCNFNSCWMAARRSIESFWLSDFLYSSSGPFGGAAIGLCCGLYTSMGCVGNGCN